MSSLKCIYKSNELKLNVLSLGVFGCFMLFFVHFPGKGEDKEYPTIGARLIRLEDKVGTLLAFSVCFICTGKRDELVRLS